MTKTSIFWIFFGSQLRFWKNLKSWLHSEYFPDFKDNFEIYPAFSVDKMFHIYFLLIDKCTTPAISNHPWAGEDLSLKIDEHDQTIWICILEL